MRIRNVKGQSINITWSTIKAQYHIMWNNFSQGSKDDLSGGQVVKAGLSIESIGVLPLIVVSYTHLKLQ